MTYPSQIPNISKLFDLSGRRAVITGGARGIGRAIADGFLEVGADVVCIDRGWESSDLPADNRQIVTADLSDRSDLKRGFDEAVERLGGQIDVLVNNAGIWDDTPSLHMELEMWDRIIEVNLTAAFVLSRHAARLMLPRGRGRIINIGSIRSLRGGHNAAAYAASKGGIALLTQTLSNEWAPSGLRVNAIAPGAMVTVLTEKLRHDPEVVTRFIERIPARRWGSPADVAGLAIFLASDASDYVTGAIIPCDGGFLAG